MPELANDFPTQEECRQLADVMMRKYAGMLGDRFIEAKARHDAQGVYVTVTLRNTSDSFHYPIEGRMKAEPQDLTKREAALFLFDYIDVYVEEYLKEGVFLPIDWADYTCEGLELQLKGQILNLAVERMGDEILEGRTLH